MDTAFISIAHGVLIALPASRSGIVILTTVLSEQAGAA
jgi:hypothetical protein